MAMDEIRLPEKSYVYKNQQYTESLTITEIDGAPSGYFRLNILSYAYVYPDGYPPEANGRIELDGVSIHTNNAFGWQTYSNATIDLPRSWRGKTVTVSGRLNGWGNVVLGTGGSSVYIAEDGTQNSGTLYVNGTGGTLYVRVDGEWKGA